MRRTVRMLTVVALCAALGIVPGCSSGPSNAASSVGPSLPALGAGQQRVELDGLVVTLTMPPLPGSQAGRAKLAAGTGRYEIELRAENTTGSMMRMHVFRNVPRLLDSHGATVTADVLPAWSAGTGVLAPASVTVSAPAIPANYSGPEGLAPHGSMNGFIVTRFDPSGRGYSVRWAFGPGNVAVFKLP